MHQFPRSEDHLHTWLQTHAHVTIPRRPTTPHNSAPFDYLSHVFFEAGALLPSSLSRSVAPPLDSITWSNRGGGKTFLGALATMLDLVFKPGVEVRILGGSLDQSRRMLHYLRQLFDKPTLEPLLDGRITDRRVRLANGSVAEILAQSQTSVRGTRVQKLRCDEVELFDPDVWEAAQLTTRSIQIDIPGLGPATVRGSIECLSTMHLPFGLMHDLVAQAADGRRTLFRWGLIDVLDNCPDERTCHTCALETECAGAAKTKGRTAGHIEIDDALRMKSRVSAATWESEMLSLRPQRSHSVYPEFDPRTHVVDPITPPRGLTLAGMDFGFRAPTVILWAVLDHTDTLWVLAERSRAETILDDHARALHAGPTIERGPHDGAPVESIDAPPAWIGVDPAGRQRSEQTGISAAHALRRSGLTVRDNQLPLHDGINLVRARLRPAAGPPRLYIHARCTTLIDSLNRYHYPPGRPESLTPEKDGPDHAADALRYLVQNLDHTFNTTCTRYVA